MNMRTSLVLLFGICATAVLQAAEPAGAPAQNDIEVTIRHTSGKVDTYTKEVASLEIVLAPSGDIRYVHMVLITDKEKDSHCWYNFANLVSLQYRYLAITGKGKVTIRQLSDFEALTKSGEKVKIPPIVPDDYK